jgi:8-oxo-dGTP diphosphatase
VSAKGDVVAAGAVLWRAGAAGIEVALVHRPRYDDWSLPKGKLDPGESAPAAAVREVGEETGHLAVLGARLGQTRYRVREGVKVVHYWAARAGDGEFQADHEVDELRWVTPPAAAPLLSYDHDRAVLRRFTELGSPPTPLLLVRHAKAGHRELWRGADDLRPLTPDGREQAERLGALLALFGPVRLHSAVPLRCPQTLEPLARELGLSITLEPLLGEDGYWRNPKAGRRRFAELAAEPGVCAVCSQGGVIPDLLAELAGITEAPSRKGSTWVLGQRDGALISADYYPDPAG